MRSPLTLAVLFAAILAALAGCSQDTPGFIPPVDTGGGGSSNDSTLFAGFLLDGQEIGRLDITVKSISLAAPLPGSKSAAWRVRAPLAPTVGTPTVTARGILQWPGGNVALNGDYDFNADTLYLAGTGFVLRGQFGGSGNMGGLSGTATSPNGSAGFVAASAPSGPWTPWCGRFHATATADSGTFGFIRADSTMGGMAFQVGAKNAIVFNGQVSPGGSPKTVFFDYSLPSFFGVTGSGTLNEVTAFAGGSYSFNIGNGNYGSSSSGTWSATPR